MNTIARTTDNAEPRHALILAAAHMLRSTVRLIGSPEGAFLDLERGERQITPTDRDTIRRAHIPFATSLNWILPPLLTTSGDVAPLRGGSLDDHYPEAHYLRQSVDRLRQVVGDAPVPPTWDRLSSDAHEELLHLLADFMLDLAPIFAKYGVSPR